MPFRTLPQLYRRPERRMPSRDIVDDIDSSQSIHVSGDRILRNAGTDIFIDGLRSSKCRLISRKRCQKRPDLDRITFDAVSSRNIRFAYAINISSGNPHSIFSCFPHRLRPTTATQQIGDAGDTSDRSDRLLGGVAGKQRSNRSRARRNAELKQRHGIHSQSSYSPNAAMHWLLRILRRC